MTTLLVEGTSGSPFNPLAQSIYGEMAQAFGAGEPICLRQGGFSNLRAAYAEFVVEADTRLGRAGAEQGADDGDPVIFIGHSQAAAHIVRYLVDHPADRAILLGGVIQGLNYLGWANSFINLSTWLFPPARSLIYGLFPLIRDLSPQSEFLAEIQRLAPLYADRVVVLVAQDDYVVPASASHIPGARVVRLPGIGHIDCLRSREVRDLVSSLIDELSIPA